MTRIWLLALAPAALLTAGQADAREFTLMIYERAEDFATRADSGPAGKAYWGGYASIGRQMAQAGILKGGGALEPDKAVRTLLIRDGKRREAQRAGGSDLTLGGYFIVDVADEAAALDWAAKIPAARTGLIEVRPHVAMTPTGM